MGILYIAFNLITLLISKGIYRKWINPVSIYSIVWSIAVGIHESGLIIYFEILPFTWFVIFFMQIVFVICSYIGFNLKSSQKTTVYRECVDSVRLKKEIKKWLLIASLIASIAVVGDFITIIRIYGTDLLKHLTDIYSDRVHQNIDLTTIPYLGAFSYIATSLAGVYLKKFGFDLYIVLPLSLGVMRSLTTGGRAGIVFIVAIFVYSYIASSSQIKKSRMKLKQKFWIVLSCFVLLCAIFIISARRSVGESLSYATDSYINLFGKNATIYKILTYLASPIGALNQYLKTCKFNFGQNTFLTIYNLLAKVGIIDRIDQYQEFFNTPEPCNVATWLRELIEDFTIAGAIPVVSLFALVTSFVYKESKMSCSIRNIVVWSVLAMIVTLSSFDWRFRSADIWIALLFGYIIGKKIDKVSGKEMVYRNDRCLNTELQ